LRKIHVLLGFWKKLFNTYLDWVFSWFLNLESWILILILGTWILNLETWFLILEFNFSLDPWSVLDSILNSFFDSWDHHLCYHELFLTFKLFVIIFVIIKTLWINLDSSWSLLLQLTGVFMVLKHIEPLIGT